MITNLTLTEETCSNCYMHFAVDSAFIAKRRKDHQTFFCPAGHRLWYEGESELEKLKRKNQSLNSQLTWAIQEAEDAKRQRKDAKTKLTKFKNRMAAGVCPCCNRTFQNVARHIAGQHPDFKEVHNGQA